MTRRKARSKKRRNRTILFWILILSLCTGVGFLSFDFFDGLLTKRDDEVAYYNEGMDLYVNVINNYELYVSNIMGVAFAINDSIKDQPENQELLKDEIVRLASMVYSYNTERASNKLDEIIMRDYVNEDKLATPIKMYHEQRHNLDIAIVQYNDYATEHELRTVTSYDSIRLLINDRTTKDRIMKSNSK